MNSSYSLALILSVTSIALLGCASSQPAGTSAKMPPSTSEMPTAVTSSDPSFQEGSIPTVDGDTGQSIPIKDLPKGKGGYPYAIKTKWSGLVKSPYAQDKKVVDVSTLPSGSAARCPHTGKIFMVP